MSQPDRAGCVDDHTTYAPMDGEVATLADVVSHMQMQRDLDNEPCTTCGGNRLRPDFVTAGRCHVPAEATR